MLAETEQFALVTGAKKGGLGFEVAKQLAINIGSSGVVFLTAHEENDAIDAADTLHSEGISVQPHELDVANQKSVARFMGIVRDDSGEITILVNNAAIFPSEDRQPVTRTSLRAAGEIFNTNVLGPLRMMRAVIPHMEERKYGRIVYIAGSWGSPSRAHDELGGKGGVYGASKAAGLYLLVSTAADLQSRGLTDVLANAIDPGKMKTNMNPTGERPPEDVAEEVIFLATLPIGSEITGRLYRYREQVPFDSYPRQGIDLPPSRSR